MLGIEVFSPSIYQVVRDGLRILAQFLMQPAANGMRMDVAWQDRDGGAQALDRGVLAAMRRQEDSQVDVCGVGFLGERVQ